MMMMHEYVARIKEHVLLHSFAQFTRQSFDLHYSQLSVDYRRRAAGAVASELAGLGVFSFSWTGFVTIGTTRGEMM
jgi:hypothetical protein